jgi:hypothetical protein
MARPKSPTGKRFRGNRRFSRSLPLPSFRYATVAKADIAAQKSSFREAPRMNLPLAFRVRRPVGTIIRATFISLALLLAGIVQNPAHGAGSAGTVEVAVSVPMSGEEKPYGTDVLEGIQLAIGATTLRRPLLRSSHVEQDRLLPARHNIQHVLRVRNLPFRERRELPLSSLIKHAERR